MAKDRPFNLNASVRGALRRLFARSPVVRQCLQKVRREVPKYKKNGELAKRPSVQYLCNVCDHWVQSTKISVDHKIPVVDLDGFVDWNVFIQRLFCGEENLQVICDDCHNAKTYAERMARVAIQYHRELDVIETTVVGLKRPYDQQVLKDLRKTIGRYIAKKKIKQLKAVSDRADKLRAVLEGI